MDEFGVPKKVNRHVIKALKKIYSFKNHENGDKAVKFCFSEVYSEVKRSMKHLRPVTNLKNFVLRSLNNNNFDNSGFSVRTRKKPMQENILHFNPKASTTFFPEAVSYSRSLNMESDEDFSRKTYKRSLRTGRKKHIQSSRKFKKMKSICENMENGLTTRDAIADEIPESIDFSEYFQNLSKTSMKNNTETKVLLPPRDIFSSTSCLEQEKPVKKSGNSRKTLQNKSKNI